MPPTSPAITERAFEQPHNCDKMVEVGFVREAVTLIVDMGAPFRVRIRNQEFKEVRAAS